ncbi:MAG TPA: hypothetical protein VNX17_08895 [Edaphobacter sp.]|nr:hypothetical protein [Edaphobacter sp.]
MANKKTKKKHTKPKRTVASKRKPVKKKVTKKLAKKKAAPKKKPALKKAAAKTKAIGKKTIAKKTEGVKPVDAFKMPPRPAVQAGDLQGLSNAETVDSESVGELIEEGNAFEAEVVAGVEDAGSHDEREVRTHEVPEDDVPGEYLDKD